MNKYYYLSGVLATAAVLSLPFYTSAQTAVDTTAAAGIGASLDSGTARPPVKPSDIRERLRVDAQKLQNLRDNEEARNNILKGRLGTASTSMMASTTRKNVMDERGLVGSTTRRMTGDDRQGLMRTASSTRDNSEAIFQMRNRMQMRLDVIKRQQVSIIHELTVALNNLKQIRTRIDSRITKAEQSTRDMSKARALLVTADVKITVADQAINALSALNISATSTDIVTASSTVNLDRPRQTANAAIKAIKDAKDSLNAVIRAIALDMGINLEEHNDIRI